MMKILVIEDDTTCRMTLNKILEKYGKVEEAEDGEKGFKMFKEAFDSGEPYKFITLDIEMPELDGHGTLKRIREYERQNGVEEWNGIYVIMMTALGDYQNISPAFKAGCEAYLVKPINQDSVRKKLIELELIEDK